MTPTIIGNYKIIKELGTGGMGTVYLAENINIGSKVAIKMLHAHLVKSENIKTRFLKEAKTQANFNHPSITKVIDFVSNDEGLFIILEFLEGETLNEFLFKNKNRLSEKEANYYMAQILDAVGYAHSKDVVHRDLKSANIMITPNKTIKIMDFGITKVANETLSFTKTGFRLGSPLYMSPEQVTNGDVDFRSDIYSLGVIYHEMLTGTPVYNQNITEFEIYNKIVKQPLPRLKELCNIDSENAQDIIDTATAKLPVARYQSCAEFKDVLNIEMLGFDSVKPVYTSQPAPINIPKPKKNIPKPTKEKVSEITKKQYSKILLIALLALILGGAVFFAANTNLWQQNTNGQSKLFEVADQFEKVGDYKNAFNTYEQIINQDPNNLIANQRLEELQNKSLQFQKQKVDSLFQLYFQVPQLNNIDFNDTQLRTKVVNEYSQLSKQIDTLKENKKIAGTTQLLDNARDQLTNAYQYFQALDKYRTVNTSRANDGNDKGAKTIENSSFKNKEVNASFSKVAQPPVFPGCTDLDPNSLNNCFSTNITTYLDSKIKPQDYENTDLAIGVHRSLFSFLIDKKGRVKKIKVRTLNNKLKRDVNNALKDLTGIKPAIQNNLPTEVTYSGSYSLTIPNKGQQNLKDANGDDPGDVVGTNEGPQVALTASLLYGKWRVEKQNAHYVLNTNKTGSYSNNRGKKKDFSWTLVGNFLNIKMDDGIVFVWQITSQTDNQIIMDDMQNNEFDKVLKRV